MSRSDIEAVRQAPLPFHGQRASAEAQLERYVHNFNKIDRSFDIYPTTRDRSFLVRSSHVQVGDTVILCAIHTSLNYISTSDEPFATFLLPCIGQATFKVDRQRYQFCAGATAVYMPGQARHCYTQLAGGTILKLRRERLAAQAAALAGDPSASERYLPSFERPWEFSEAVPIQRHLLALLRKTIGLIDLVPGQPTTLPEHLHLDDLLYRGVALLTHPELLASPSG